MGDDAAISRPPVFVVDLSPILAESVGGTFSLAPFEVEELIDGESFHGVAHLRIDRTNRGVRIVGVVDGRQVGACGRCLAATTAPLEAAIDEEALESNRAGEGALLIGKGNSIDIGRLALEALDLARHLVLSCTPPCPERCGLCGGEHPADACPERSLDPRLAGLASLLPHAGDEEAPIG